MALHAEPVQNRRIKALKEGHGEGHAEVVNFIHAARQILAFSLSETASITCVYRCLCYSPLPGVDIQAADWICERTSDRGAFWTD